MYDLFVRLEILSLFSVMVLITLSIPCKLSMSYESIILSQQLYTLDRYYLHFMQETVEA